MAEATGAEVIPAGRAFWEYARKNPSAVMFEDMQHPSETGATVIAQCFYDTLHAYNTYNKTVAFSQKTLNIPATNSVQLQVTAPEGSVLSFSSSDTKVAEISADGVVTGKVYGIADVYVKDEKGNTGKCRVKVGFSDIIEGVTTPAVFKTVTWGVENGIISGFNGGESFGPERSCTRAQFVTFLWRLAGRPSSSGSVSFTDVNSSMSDYKPIRWAVSAGIIVGYHDGTFRPSNTVTRRQVAVMLWRWHGRTEPTITGSKFSDMSESDSSYRAVMWGEETGVIRGSNGQFMPSQECLRRQVITFFYRYARSFIDTRLP